jgi:nucleoid-associated protein YgaU
MRKDAKIGFAIGGVLLVVLTVYAIVVPKHKKPVSTVSIVNAPSNETPATPPLMTGGNGTSAPVTPPVDSAPVVHPEPTAVNIPSTPAIPPVDAGTAPVTPADGATKPDAPRPEQVAGLTPDHPMTPANEPVQPRSKPTRSHTAELEVPAPTPAGDRTYVVQSGQTLSSIASEVYGNPRFWVAIVRENKSINPNRLKVGTKINLPDITPVQPGAVEEAADVETPANVVERPHTVTPPADRSTPTDAHTYVVKSGDSLYKIARTVLGSGHKADALYALNRVVIGADKSRLKAGMVLKLPDSDTNGLATSASAR